MIINQLWFLGLIACLQCGWIFSTASMESTSASAFASLHEKSKAIETTTHVDIVASNSISGKKKDSPPEDASPTAGSKEYPDSLDPEKLALFRQIEASQSIDELFQWIDEVS